MSDVNACFDLTFKIQQTVLLNYRASYRKNTKQSILQINSVGKQKNNQTICARWEYTFDNVIDSCVWEYTFDNMVDSHVWAYTLDNIIH